MCNLQKNMSGLIQRTLARGHRWPEMPGRSYKVHKFQYRKMNCPDDSMHVRNPMQTTHILRVSIFISTILIYHPHLLRYYEFIVNIIDMHNVI